MGIKMDRKNINYEESLLSGGAKQAKPTMFELVLEKTDTVPNNFALSVLKSCFHKSEDDSLKAMMDIHHTGQVVCGVYTKDIAETKMSGVIDFAHDANYAINCFLREHK